jgi:hypothetical protein
MLSGSIPQPDEYDVIIKRFKETFPFECLVQLGDLPSGWISQTIYGGINDPEVPDAVVGMANYLYPSSTFTPGFHLGQLILVKKDRSHSTFIDEKYFNGWNKMLFKTNDWKRPLSVEFTPKDNQDLYTLACKNDIRVMNCGFVYQHKYVVSYITLETDAKAISLQEFVRVLQAVDNRCQ